MQTLYVYYVHNITMRYYMNVGFHSKLGIDEYIHITTSNNMATTTSELKVSAYFFCNFTAPYPPKGTGFQFSVRGCKKPS